jgi:radical SAM-linked protein
MNLFSGSAGQRKEKGMHITVSNQTVLVLIKFNVSGNLRFLSHAETARVFQRACVRAGIDVQYSQGFNPRPKLSLPLPRTVGVESNDDLLCLKLKAPQHADNQSATLTAAFDVEAFKAGLSAQLPEGLELLSVELAEAKSAPQSRLVKYLLKVRPEYFNEVLKARIKNLLEHKRLNMDRWMNTEKSKIKNRKSKIKSVDVRPFLKSVRLCEQGIVVECITSSSGSIRVDEILKLLELDYEMLTGPIKRTAMQWQEAKN